MNKYTVFFDQVNRVNYQIKAIDEDSARDKAIKIYRKNFQIPPIWIEAEWICEEDGED